jgi:exosortase C (VPDSG-CTERM-specific)
LSDSISQVVGWRALPSRERLRIAAWLGWIAVVTLAFLRPLIDLEQHAAGSEMHSYIPLVPFVALYLLHFRRKTLPTAFRTSIAGSLVLCGVGVLAWLVATRWSGTLSLNDFLGLKALAYVSVIAGGGFLFLGSRWMAAAAFPMAFLIFVVPLPDAAVYWIERASVLASAEVSALFFRMTGTPLLRDGTVFALPGIVLQIAQECSGIHSSWVLFITSLVASQIFLTSPWRRLILVAFVFPLAIVRNSFRILVIGLLCVYVDPSMIDSYIHRHGGPIFFVLSLGPLFLLLVWLRRQER